MNNFALVFLILEIFFVGGYILFSSLNYKDRFRMQYDLKNHFPYEFNFESKFKDNFMGNLFFFLAAASAITFYILFDNNKENGYYLFIMIGGIVLSLVNLLLSYVPLKLLKTHLALVTLDIILSFLIPFALAISASMTYHTTHDNTLIAFIIIPALICLTVFILMMNPKLTRWSKMDEIKNEDGTTTYVRPRFFILAFYEWILLFISLISQIVLIVSTLIIK